MVWRRFWQTLFFYERFLQILGWHVQGVRLKACRECRKEKAPTLEDAFEKVEICYFGG
jgi:hypothetical protein